jgi:tetratricopeptide (TPR) repeat protein
MTVYGPEGDDLKDSLGVAMPILYEQYGLWLEAEGLRTRELESLALNESTQCIEIMVTSNKLASIYWRLHRLRDAERLQEEFVFWSQDMFGDNNLDTLQAMSLLARIYMSDNRLEHAESLLMRVINGTSFIGELGSEVALMARQDLARISFKRGFLNLAIEQQLHLANEAAALWGQMHLTTINVFNDLALTYLSQGQSHVAEAMLERILHDHISLFGLKHPNTFTYKSNLARAYADQGKFELAVLLLIEIVATWQETIPDHPATAMVIYDLATTYTQMGDLEAARKVQETALVHLPSDISFFEELRRGWVSDASKISPWTYPWILVAAQYAIAALLPMFLSWLSSVRILWFLNWWSDNSIKDEQSSLVANKYEGPVQGYSPQMCYIICDWQPHGLPGDEDNFWWVIWTVAYLYVFFFDIADM